MPTTYHCQYVAEPTEITLVCDNVISVENTRNESLFKSNADYIPFVVGGGLLIFAVIFVVLMKSIARGRSKIDDDSK